MEPQSQYILTQDTGAITQSVFGESIPTIDDKYFTGLRTVLTDRGVGPGIEIVGYSEQDIEEELGDALRVALDADPTAICICLDRFLLSDLEIQEQYQERFTRFSMTRAFDGTKVSRQMAPDFNTQVEAILQQYPDITERNIVVVDDGLFTGGTVNDLLKILASYGLEKNISKVIGYIGNGTPELKSDLEVQIIRQIQSLYDWIDIRDFGIFGGKKMDAGRNNLAATAVPYIAPWSDGRPASLDKLPVFFEISREMLRMQKELIQDYERVLGEELTFRQLLKLGFPLPTNPEKTIPISINDRVVDYIANCVELIEKEEQRKVIILDMDGTLYNLDGDDGGFSNSTLNNRVNQNAIDFIINWEKCSLEKAQAIFKEAQADPVGASVFLSQRYGISREDYFNNVWDIDPTGIFETEQALIKEIKRLGGGKFGSDKAKLILLTAAPKVWMERVFSFFDLTDAFETRITGEEYRRKDEIFQLLAGRYKPENVLSIGDQEYSDIIPARNYGLNAMRVSGPKDTAGILKEVAR